MYKKEFEIKHPVARIITLFIAIVGISIYVYRSGNWKLITGDWSTHTSEAYCYSFQYPGWWDLYTSGDEGWHGQVRPNQRAMLLEKPKPYLLGQIYFTIDQIPMENPTLEDVATWSLNDISENEAFSDLNPYIINEKPALIRFFSSNQSETTETYIARKHDGLVLRMSTKEGYHEEALNTFQKIVDSFEYQQCEYLAE